METKNKPSIAYQNKDIASKILAENFKSKSLGVYGLDLQGLSGRFRQTFRRFLQTNSALTIFLSWKTIRYAL